MFEQMLSAEAWKSVETGSKWFGIAFGFASAFATYVNYQAGLNAKIRSEEPRGIPSASTNLHSVQSAMQPLSALVVSHGSAEADDYAQKLSAEMPSGSQVAHMHWESLHGLPAKRADVLYEANGLDPAPLLEWFKSRGIEAAETDFVFMPWSTRIKNKDKFFILVGPKK